MTTEILVEKCMVCPFFRATQYGGVLCTWDQKNPQNLTAHALNPPPAICPLRTGSARITLDPKVNQ